ncbi:unnamed protein product (macronuclear) [Paramecium tetraurelia]|uniref:Ciliary BBSome complex subunit 2 N-terminal domain-containing protein n=1 Tax=Paramecium tetraurelia TaxID=5888 RepID=A0DF76_PARTE|nr:uncharacterized protein GSPATT00016506001 [Paramecium tetraurelia]CAK81693.1 unnamed protein product [Paramecium tetraurelia]|eukprot:XP_001449090.1 hypothetical protein (macronuclear) [Paramecium tetraurelia strain d4-2]
MFGLRLSENIAVVQEDQQHEVLDIKGKEVITYKDFIIVGCLDKTVKVYKNLQLTFTLKLLKKVKRITVNESNDSVYVCDKHGDMWSFQLGQEGIQSITKEMTPIQTNLAIPKCFKYLEINDQKVIILGDSYCKIKVYNANNIDELLWVWIPFEGFLKQIIQDGEYILMLFKRFDEHENQYYQVYQIKQTELLKQQPNFEQIFDDQDLSKQVIKAHLISKSLLAFQFNFNKLTIYKIDQNKQLQIFKETLGYLIDVQFSKHSNNHCLSIKSTQQNQENNIIILDHQLHFIDHDII